MWNKRVKRRERKENAKSIHSNNDIADSKLKSKYQSMDQDSEGSDYRDGYDFEILEHDQYE